MPYQGSFLNPLPDPSLSIHTEPQCVRHRQRVVVDIAWPTALIMVLDTMYETEVNYMTKERRLARTATAAETPDRLMVEAEAN